MSQESLKACSSKNDTVNSQNLASEFIDRLCCEFTGFCSIFGFYDIIAGYQKQKEVISCFVSFF